MALMAKLNNRDWEATFTAWSVGPGKTEDEKCENAIRAIRKAIDNSDSLKNRSISVFLQGSYRNHTNVRQDSDVDVCIFCDETFYYDFQNDLNAERCGITPAKYHYSDFKNDLEKTLVAHFGREAVVRGNKAFDIHENTYRVNADAVGCFQHRTYYLDSAGQIRYRAGTELLTDDGKLIQNYPQQQYDNGVAKNEATRRNFKPTVRILKNLRNEMMENGIAAAQPIPSFLIESLAWNVPDEGFLHATRYADIQYVLAHLFNETRTDDTCKEWTESNNVKYLFRPQQPWTRVHVNTFTDAAWNYVGYQ